MTRTPRPYGAVLRRRLRARRPPDPTPQPEASPQQLTPSVSFFTESPKSIPEPDLKPRPSAHTVPSHSGAVSTVSERRSMPRRTHRSRCVPWMSSTRHGAQTRRVRAPPPAAGRSRTSLVARVRARRRSARRQPRPRPSARRPPSCARPRSSASRSATRRSTRGRAPWSRRVAPDAGGKTRGPPSLGTPTALYPLPADSTCTS